ncbi:hypothetical protein [Thalassomonas sp. RHCl1]|uniref:hypothetical protein n=1 Tax=Thalassomonas sp. RHCl1 TaxID=2995320 RepID=UPI00248AA6B8|nr:hypothetical protein [Thalassomonas sp. RHCl1]
MHLTMLGLYALWLYTFKTNLALAGLSAELKQIYVLSNYFGSGLGQAVWQCGRASHKK